VLRELVQVRDLVEARVALGYRDELASRRLSPLLLVADPEHPDDPRPDPATRKVGLSSRTRASSGSPWSRSVPATKP
jgi:hypothetical protein